MKTCTDFLISILCFILIGPLIAFVYILFKLIYGKSVLFIQQRPGLHGKPFPLYKFRTMSNGWDPKGNLLPDKERMTKLGKFLRSTSLDELPELFNVLKGDMSLVGPRPLLMEYLPLYTPDQARRHEVKPGITGWAQVNGRNAISWEEKFKLDVWYVENQSFWLDLKILWMTLFKVFRREGISQEGQATMEKFKGTI
jgi:sugar transferase EpsL